MIWKKKSKEDYLLIWYEKKIKEKKEGFGIKLKGSCWKFGNEVHDGLIEWMDMKGKKKHFLTLDWKVCVYEVIRFTIDIRCFH